MKTPRQVHMKTSVAIQSNNFATDYIIIFIIKFCPAKELLYIF